MSFVLDQDLVVKVSARFDVFSSFKVGKKSHISFSTFNLCLTLKMNWGWGWDLARTLTPTPLSPRKICRYHDSYWKKCRCHGVPPWLFEKAAAAAPPWISLEYSIALINTIVFNCQKKISCLSAITQIIFSWMHAQHKIKKEEE